MLISVDDIRVVFYRQELEALCKIYSKLTTNPGARTGTSAMNNGVSAPHPAIEVIY